MSYAVIHMQKFKISGVKGIQFHNQRERESRTNPDIDKSKSHLNYDLANSENIDFNKKIKNIIKNNVKTDRAIRKDAVVMCNFVITSDKKFFDNISVEERDRFFKEAYKFFSDRYGERNIIASNVHLDEKTPHMHLSIVPVTSDNKLSAKRLLDRNELRSIQDDFPKFVQSKGFNLKRGIDAEGKNKHIDTQKLKVIELDQKNKILLEEQELIKKEIEKLELQKVKSKQVINAYNDIPRGKKVLGKVILSENEWNKLFQQTQSYWNEKMKSKNFENENKILTEENEILNGQNKLLKENTSKLLEFGNKLSQRQKILVDFINNKIPNEIKKQLPMKELVDTLKKADKPINQVMKGDMSSSITINKHNKNQKIEMDM